ncbi:Uncharacterised protein [Capnocytophaga ochracea]|uniref:Bacterial Ig-like domain (Group 2) n=2 Tax=Capnocytophaga ochracea TaxID=1018 RepID=A0A2X2RW73_CAPOC|nr:Uncharacterised protein [Capnocytophaga ochracea]
MKTRLMMLALLVLASATLFSCKKDDKEGDSNIVLGKSAVTLNLGGQETIKVTAPDGIKKPQSEDVNVAIATVGRDIWVTIQSKQKVGETRVKIESKTGNIAYINVTVKDKETNDRGLVVLGKTVFVDRDQEVEVTNLLKKYNDVIDKVNIKSTSSALAQVRKDGNRFFVKGIGEGLTGEVYFEDTAGENDKKKGFPKGSFIVHVRAPFLAVQSGEVGVGQNKRIDLTNIYNNAFTFEGVNNDIASVEYARELDGVGKELSNGNFTGIKVTGKKEGTFTLKLTNSDGDNGKGRELSLTIIVSKVDTSNFIIEGDVLKGVKAGVTLTGAVIIPANVKKIATEAFKNQSVMESINLNNVEEIELDAFLGAINLAKVEMPNVKIIGQRAFNVTTKLKEIDLPATLQKIKTSAFAGSGLVKVTCRAITPPECDRTVFARINSSPKLVLYVPASSVQTYKTQWRDVLSPYFGGLMKNDYTPYPIP